MHQDTSKFVRNYLYIGVETRSEESSFSEFTKISKHLVIYCVIPLTLAHSGLPSHESFKSVKFAISR